MAIILRASGGLNNDEFKLITQIGAALKIQPNQSADIVGHLVDFMRGANISSIIVAGVTVDRDKCRLEFHCTDSGFDGIVAMSFDDSDFTKFKDTKYEKPESPDQGFFYAPYIPIIRKTAPNLVAHDLVGVQPMQMPTGLIFTMGKNNP